MEGRANGTLQMMAFWLWGSRVLDGLTSWVSKKFRGGMGLARGKGGHQWSEGCGREVRAEDRSCR